jgi:hypothetical protein
MTNNPWVYWKFEETNDTLTSSMQAYDYSGHNFDATYGNSDGTPQSGCLDGGENISLYGQYGPNPNDYLNGYPGLPSTNGCAKLSSGYNNGYLTVPPLNLNTNTVTFTMWIYPNDFSPVIAANSGLLMNRNGYDAAGVGFSANRNANLTASLGYTWNNNSPATYNWDSGLYPLPQQWQFVAYVISPQNTTIYQYYVSGGVTNLLKAVSNIANAPEAFSGGTTWLGSDVGDGTICNRTFNGYIDEVAVFTNAMSENQIQGLFLRALGLTTGIAPVFTVQPTNTTLYIGQTLQLTAIAIGIPTPNYQWQVTNAAGPAKSWTNIPNNAGIGIGGATDSTFYWTNFIGAFSNFRCLATNLYGRATSSVATVTILPVPRWNSGIWTVNFDVITANNSGPNVPYVGRGVLGTGTYWNTLSGDLFSNTPPSLLDDSVTHCPVNLGATNHNGNWATQSPWNSILMDQYMQVGTNGTSMVFTGVPIGRYNLALYGIDGSNANRGTIFTVQGVSKSVTNAQDVFLLPDNTVIYTNLVVTNGILEVHMVPVPSVPTYPLTNYEGDFNGAQLEMIAGPYIVSLTNRAGTNFVLTYGGGQLLEATNILGPWTTNLTATNPFTIYPTGRLKFYRIYTNNY